MIIPYRTVSALMVCATMIVVLPFALTRSSDEITRKDADVRQSLKEFSSRADDKISQIRQAAERLQSGYVALSASSLDPNLLINKSYSAAITKDSGMPNGMQQIFDAGQNISALLDNIHQLDEIEKDKYNDASGAFQNGIPDGEKHRDVMITMAIAITGLSGSFGVLYLGYRKNMKTANASLDRLLEASFAAPSAVHSSSPPETIQSEGTSGDVQKTPDA